MVLRSRRKVRTASCHWPYVFCLVVFCGPVGRSPRRRIPAGQRTNGSTGLGRIGALKIEVRLLLDQDLLDIAHVQLAGLYALVGGDGRRDAGRVTDGEG